MTLTEQATAYHQQALGSDEALEYFHGRGLTDRSISRFQLGWIAEPLTPEAHKFAGKPVIPYLSLSGKVIWLKVRSGWDKPYPKYMPLGHDFPLAQPKVHLFNARQAMPSLRRRDVYLLEGEFDTIIVNQCGYKACGVPSATTFYPSWVHLFEEASVHVVLDGDKAGTDGAAKLAEAFTQARVLHEIRTLPKGYDITDLYLGGGRDWVERGLGIERGDSSTAQ